MNSFRIQLFLLCFLSSQNVSDCRNLIERVKRTVILTTSPCLGQTFGQKSPISQSQRISSSNDSLESRTEDKASRPNQTNSDSKSRIKRFITITLGGGGGCGGGCDGGCGGSVPPLRGFRSFRKRKSDNLNLDTSSSGLNEDRKKVKYMVIPSPFLTSLLTMGRVGIQDRLPVARKSNKNFLSRQSTTRDPVTATSFDLTS